MKISKPTLRMTILAASLSVIGVVSGANLAPEDYVYQYAGPPVRAGATGTCVRTSFWAPGVNDANCGGHVEARQPTPPVTQSVTTSATVPEFVSEPEPAGMVPVPPMTPAWSDDGITGSALYYDEDARPSRGDGIIARSENDNFPAEVATAEAQMAQSRVPPAAPASPAPAIAAVAQPAAQSNHLTLDGETYFEFNKSNLTPLGQEQLDKLLAGLSGTQYETIAITGHTDRLGTDTYNKKLSERRALEVKRYLSKKGIDANKIQTKWVGATEPQTAPGACEGLNRKETIACLAPDRRVELEVVGMQEQSSARR